MCNTDNIKKTISLMKGMSPIEQEKLTCVAQGMALVRGAAEQANDTKHPAAADDRSA